MEKDLTYGILLQIYGELLTNKQQEVASLYYDYDLSLAEISENLGISRQAVLDSLHNACDSLRYYEEKLNIQMGVDGRYLFNDQFSEASIFDFNGNNMI